MVKVGKRRLDFARDRYVLLILPFVSACSISVLWGARGCCCESATTWCDCVPAFICCRHGGIALDWNATCVRETYLERIWRQNACPTILPCLHWCCTEQRVVRTLGTTKPKHTEVCLLRRG